MVLVALMLLFFVLGIIIPFIFAVFVSSGSNGSEGSTMPLIAVYGAYGGFIALSTLAEGGIPGKLRSTLRPESGATHLICNRYLMIKWCQGQIANLDTFVHICFVASVVAQ